MTRQQLRQVPLANTIRQEGGDIAIQFHTQDVVFRSKDRARNGHDLRRQQSNN